MLLPRNQFLCDLLRQDCDPVAIAFACPQRHLSPIQIDVFDPQIEQFAASQPRPILQLGGETASVRQIGQHRRHFGEAQDHGQVADALTDAAATTLKQFQRNNWKVDGGFLSVLHTWGSALNWHPHLHVLVSAGGVDPATGRWKPVQREYSFPVKPMSKVLRSILLARLEALDRDVEMRWPDGWPSVEERRQRRVELCARNFNVFSKATLRNTRAVVRYLARYTSRIAMSNARLVAVDAEKREVTFRWKDYKDGGRIKERTVSGKRFIRLFTRHLVPKGYRRIRYFGWLTGGGGGIVKGEKGTPGAISERAIPTERPACACCQAREWHYFSFFVRLQVPTGNTLATEPKERFSLVGQRAGP